MSTNFDQIIRTSEEQGVAAWVEELNRVRAMDLLAALTRQDGNLERAIGELNQVQVDVGQLIASNRGGIKGAHGFIAEVSEAGIQNARSLVRGLNPAYKWVNDNGPVDLFRDGTPIQQKFVRANGHFGFEHIGKHLTDYPDFVRSGGKYQIPKDFYEELRGLMDMTQDRAAKESAGTYSLWKWFHAWFEDTGLTMDDIEPSTLNYADVQSARIGKTLQDEKGRLLAEDRVLRQDTMDAHSPSWQQGLGVAAVSAGLESATGFLLAMQKVRKCRRFQDFTADDWRTVGIETVKSGTKGAVRGGAVYALSNLCCTPAPIANAYVTAAFGVVSQAYHLHCGRITLDDFIVNSETLCLDMTMSTLSSMLGQALIPIPVLGAIIGNVAGMYLYQIGKNYLSARDQKLIAEYQAGFEQLDRQLRAQYSRLVAQLERELRRFQSLMVLAFDRSTNVDTALQGSVFLARFAGVPETQILKTKEQIDDYFLR